MTVAPTAPGTGVLAQLDATDSPLSALSAAGFGFLRDAVSFLEEPLKQLAGDSGAVSSTAQGLRATGDSLSSLATKYRTSSATQTSRWSGDAADAYRTVGTQHADGIATLGQAAGTVSGAVSDAGTTVAQTAQGVRQDITDAVAQMLPIMTEAKARASATNGVSVAQAIPKCVRIAADYGRRIVARMRALLSNGQNLKELVDKTIRTIEAVTQALSGPGTQGGPTTGSGPTSSGSTGPQQSGTQQSGAQQSSQSGSQSASPAGGGTAASPADSTAGTSNTTSASDYLGPSAASSGSDSSGSQVDGGTSGDTGTSSTSSMPWSATTPQSADSGTLSSSLPAFSDSSGGTGSGTIPGDDPAIGISGSGNGLAGPGSSGGRRGEAGQGSGSSRASGTSGSGATGGFTGPLNGSRGNRTEDKEHRKPAWLRGEQGIFEPDEVAPAIIDTSPDDGDDFAAPRRPEPVEEPVEPEPVEEEPEVAPPEPMTAEVLRRAAAHRDAPPRLLRAADAVLEGKFTWEEAANYQSPHPLAQALFTPKAKETLWPMLRETAERISKESKKPPAPARPAPPRTEERH